MKAWREGGRQCVRQGVRQPNTYKGAYKQGTESWSLALAKDMPAARHFMMQ